MIQVAYTALAITYCILLIATARDSSGASAAGIPAATLALVASVLLAVFASLEHTRALAPSPAPIFFLSVTALLDVARVRTLYLTDKTWPAATLSAGLALRLLLLGLESRSKKNDLAAALPSETSPEKLAGPISRTMFHWVNPLLLLGFRGSLKGRRLGPIDPQFGAAYLTERFAAVPGKIQGKAYDIAKAHVFWLMQSFSWDSQRRAKLPHLGLHRSRPLLSRHPSTLRFLIYVFAAISHRRYAELAHQRRSRYFESRIWLNCRYLFRVLWHCSTCRPFPVGCALDLQPFSRPPTVGTGTRSTDPSP